MIVAHLARGRHGSDFVPGLVGVRLHAPFREADDRVLLGVVHPVQGRHLLGEVRVGLTSEPHHVAAQVGVHVRSIHLLLRVRPKTVASWDLLVGVALVLPDRHHCVARRGVVVP